MDSGRTLRRDLETVFRAGTLAGLSDGQLLDRFTARRGDTAGGGEAESEAIFALLIERHGAMVLRVCRGVLGDRHEAEDALQATFLVLLRQARSIRNRDSLAAWLHGVAHRVAMCARSDAARRHARERRWFERRRADSSDAERAAGELDLSETIHAELERLPERYRAPIVLCDLEGRSLDEAARQLDWPLGTIKSRLNRGRQRLRDRLLRRGVAPGVAGAVLSGALSVQPAEAAAVVSAALVEATARVLAGTSTPAVAVLALVDRIGRMMIMSKIKFTAITALALGISAVGIGALAGGLRGDSGENPKAPTVAAAPTAQKADITPARKKIHAPDESRREPITVTGRATDPAGRPVAGATVYLINANLRMTGDGRDVLATATTGPDGRYTARNVELPVWKPSPGPLPAFEEGRFQVAAAAPGFGFTWNPTATFRPDRRPTSGERKGVAGEPEAFYRDEPIAIDLAFEPAASLHGKVVDDRGRPMAGVLVQVGVCNAGLHGQRMWSCRRVDPKDPAPDERREFGGIRALPEAILSTRTGPDGSYRIDGLPREAQFLAQIDPGPEYEPFQGTVATTDAPFANVTSLGHDGTLDRTFISPRPAGFTIRYADTGKPARGVTVRATSDRQMLRAGCVATTDAGGRAILRLRPGDYGLVIEPPAGDDHLPARDSFQVGQGEITEVNTSPLKPAAIVTMQARDAKTGDGVAGVQFRYETDSDSRRRELQSQLGVVDHPATDGTGRLRAAVEPGRKRFFAAEVPQGWKLEGPPGRPAILVAGRETTIRWSLVRVEEPKTPPASGPEILPKVLAGALTRQQQVAQQGRYRIRHYTFFTGDDPIPPGELEAFLDATDLAAEPDPAATLGARFPQLPEAKAVYYEIIDDGHRRRNVYGFSAETQRDNVLVDNGREVVRYDGSNGQSDIMNARANGSFRVFGLPNVCTWPTVSPEGRLPGPATAQVRRTESGGRLALEITADDWIRRLVLDRKTGFLHAETLRPLQGAGGYVLRQYGPRTHRDGVVLPTVAVRGSAAGSGVHLVELTRIDEVDFGHRSSPQDFTVPAPAGTVILDYRDDRSHPRQGSNRYPVADVLVYAEGMSSRNRRVDPVLKVGDPAPPIQPASWLLRDGESGPPDVTGKVVLVDFWGISCGFCVVELPEVQAAAAHFADKGGDLVVIGLHENSATADEVAAFARKRGLTYRLAIDRPADEEGWFGATFQEYGVRSIPAAAVIDRQGKVAFVGSFREALQEAAKRLGQ